MPQNVLVSAVVAVVVLARATSAFVVAPCSTRFGPRPEIPSARSSSARCEAAKSIVEHLPAQDHGPRRLTLDTGLSPEAMRDVVRDLAAQARVRRLHEQREAERARAARASVRAPRDARRPAAAGAAAARVASVEALCDHVCARSCCAAVDELLEATAADARLRLLARLLLERDAPLATLVATFVAGQQRARAFALAAAGDGAPLAAALEAYLRRAATGSALGRDGPNTLATAVKILESLRSAGGADDARAFAPRALAVGAALLADAADARGVGALPLREVRAVGAALADALLPLDEFPSDVDDHVEDDQVEKRRRAAA